MFQSNLDLPLNNKKVYHNLTELLPKVGNFWSHRFRVMNFLFTTPEFYAIILCIPVSSSGILLHLVQMADPKVMHLRIKRFLSLTETLWKVETFRSGLCMQYSFIAVRTYLVHVFASGSDICHLFQMSASGSMTGDSLELPRGGWFSCTFVGHPKGLWVRRVSRVLST
jgi:hypothetical protein